MGRITKVFPGQDGNIRSAEVATLHPSGRVIHVKRPLEKLYPLEVRSTANVEKEKRNELQIRPIMDENIPLFIVDNNDI